MGALVSYALKNMNNIIYLIWALTFKNGYHGKGTSST